MKTINFKVEVGKQTIEFEFVGKITKNKTTMKLYNNSMYHTYEDICDAYDKPSQRKQDVFNYWVNVCAWLNDGDISSLYITSKNCMFFL